MAIPKQNKSLLKSKKKKRQQMASMEKEAWGKATMKAEEFADDQDIDFDDEYIQNIRMDMYQDLMKQFRATLK
tara:strand:- start:1259 stop:1477 length:219 start_codon:yes stop_codon:yes gene_type:complete